MKMRYSDWASLPIGLEGRREELMYELSMVGKKTYRITKRLERQSNQDPDYSKIAELLEKMNEMLNIYNRLVGNIVFANDDDRIINLYVDDYGIYQQRIEFNLAEARKSHANNSIILPELYTEIKSVQHHMYQVLDRAKQMMDEHGTDFDEALIETIKLMGGRLHEKGEQGQAEYIPPNPDAELQPDDEEDISEEDEFEEDWDDEDFENMEEIENDEGWQVWSEVAENL